MQPLVSCIMPVTADRAAYIPHAVNCFKRQTYPARELVIVADEGNYRLPDEESNIRIVFVPPGRTIGSKRNTACQHALGEYVAHWDSDDWYHHIRLERQIAFYEKMQVALTGISPIHFLNEANGEAWVYNDTDYACDTTRFYKKQYWERVKFIDANDQQDTEFWNAAGSSRKVLRHAGLVVASIHPGNTSPRNQMESDNWHRTQPDSLLSSIRFSS